MPWNKKKALNITGINCFVFLKKENLEFFQQNYNKDKFGPKMKKETYSL